MAADPTIRIVKGKTPAREQLSGILRTPPPIMVAVILKVAAANVAWRFDDWEDGTKKATSAMDVALFRNGTKVRGKCCSSGDLVTSTTLGVSKTDGSSITDVALPPCLPCP